MFLRSTEFKGYLIASDFSYWCVVFNMLLHLRRFTSAPLQKKGTRAWVWCSVRVQTVKTLLIGPLGMRSVQLEASFIECFMVCFIVCFMELGGFQWSLMIWDGLQFLACHTIAEHVLRPSDLCYDLRTRSVIKWNMLRSSDISCDRVEVSMLTLHGL